MSKMKLCSAPSSSLTSVLHDGYAVLPSSFDGGYIAELNRHCDDLIDVARTGGAPGHGNLGAILDFSYQTGPLVDFFLRPNLLSALADAGLPGSKFWKGYIIAKDPGSSATYWHQDWSFWDNPVSLDPRPNQIFLMTYLTDTNRQNGCLRVIPGSHRTRHALHKMLGGGHEDRQVVYGDQSHVGLYATYPDEVDVCVRKGDIIIGDARLLHAVHPNTNTSRRTLIVFDVLPYFEQLPVSIRTACSDTAIRPAASVGREDHDRIGRMLVGISDNDRVLPERSNRRPLVRDV